MKDDRISDFDEITLKELIVILQGYLKEIFKFWWLVGLACLLFAIGFVYVHLKHIPQYKAELRFVVEGQSGGGGGLSSLLGSIGINKGGKVNPFKVIEVGKSTTLLNRTLSHRINDKNIANKLLNIYGLNDKWGENYSNFTFGEVVDFSGSEISRSAIKKLRTMIWGNENIESLTSLDLDEDTGVYTLSTKTVDEDLSLKITNALYTEIKNFFEEEVFRNQKRLADILSMKADSIKTLNESKIRQLARILDSNRGIVSNVSMVEKTILNQESLALSTAYAEILKNKEMTDVNLKDMQPLFMAIDTPFGPLVPTSSSLFSAILKGILLGLFVSIFFILTAKIYRDIMSN